jgi:hypothetical protein
MYEQSKLSELIRFARVDAGSAVIDVYPGNGDWTRLFSEVMTRLGAGYGVSPAPDLGDPHLDQPQHGVTLARRHLSRSLICRSMPSDTTPGTIRGPKCCANAASSPIGQQRANQVNASSPNLPLTLPTQHRASAAAPVPATARRAWRCAARRRTVATDMLDLRSACGGCSHLSVVVFASLRATAHCGEPRFAPSKYRP